MGVGKYFSKFILTIIFLSLWAASACLIGVGAYVWSQAGSLDSIAKSTYALVPTVIVIGSGIFLFMLGVIGCFACLNENRCLLGTFFILLLAILLGEFTAAGLGIAYHSEVRDSIDRELNVELNAYHNDTLLQSEIDVIQSTYRCCGVRNYTDWLETRWSQEHNGRVPDSCCSDKNCTDEPLPNSRLFTAGCLSKLEADFAHYLGLIVAFALVVAVLQTLGLIASCALMARERRHVQYQPFGGVAGVDDTQHV